MKKMKLIIVALATLFAVNLRAQDDKLTQLIRSHAAENDPVKSAALMKKIIKENKLNTAKHAETVDILKGNVAVDHLQAGNYAEFDKLVMSMSNKFNQTSYLSMAASMLIDEKKDLPKAEELAKRALDLYLSYKDDPKAKPASYSQEDWDRFMNFAYFPYCDTYAAALHAVGKNKEALEYQGKAMDGDPESGMPASVERYTKLLVLNQQQDKAYDLLLAMAKKGKSTAGMNALLKELYVSKNDPAGFTAFFDELQKEVVNTLKQELKGKMQDQEAPGFTLKDLDGKTVSLSDFKGQIVVIDFWATWCAPCKASFPAMKKIMAQYPDVKFLYIATQEKQEGAKERVAKYIADNAYPFHVLMDEPTAGNPQQFQALSAYKPQGIPAKYVIDKNGKQRFMSTGFTTDTELINELNAMIQLAAENS